VGCATPDQVSRLFAKVRQEAGLGDDVVLSIHCHNDLGLAVANSLAAVLEGAGQVHCTVNGIGERAGNTPLEELAAVFEVHGESMGVSTGIQLDRIHSVSRLVRRLTGISLQAHKPLVGDHSFVYHVGVPQLADAVEKPPYEIVDPGKLGIRAAMEPLDERASMEQFQARMIELGYEVKPQVVEQCYGAFRDLAAKKEQVTDADLELLLNEILSKEPARFKLMYLSVSAGSISVPNATVQLEVDGETIQDAGFGHGPVDAAFKTIFKIVKRSPRLLRYEVNAATSGSDAQGEVTVSLEDNGLMVNGRGLDTDIVLASAKALVDGLNKLDRIQENPSVFEFTEEESFMPRL